MSTQDVLFGIAMLILGLASHWGAVKLLEHPKGLKKKKGKGQGRGKATVKPDEAYLAELKRLLKACRHGKVKAVLQGALKEAK